MLVTDIVEYIHGLTREFPSITSVWLIGSRANACFKDSSDWDLLAFADEKTFEQIKKADNFKCTTIDLLIVYNGNNFEEPWPDIGNNVAKSGSLKDWKWLQLSEHEATYKGTKDLPNGKVQSKILKAINIWHNT
jgi:hypothetical protein